MEYQPITKDNASRLIQIGMLGRGTPHSVKYSPRGDLLAVSSSCGIWLYSPNAIENEPTLLRAESTCENLAFSPDGKTLAACCNDGSVLIWNVHTGKRIAILKGFPNVLWAIDFSPDGLSLAIGGQGNPIWIYGTDDFKVKHILDHHRHGNFAAGVSSVKFSPNGKYLGSRGNDAVWIWDVATGQARLILPQAVDLAFSPDGENLAVGAEHLWFHNLQTKEQTVFPISDTHGIGKLCFSPDGNLLALECTDKTIRLWRTDSHQELSILHGHTGSIHSLMFSPDGAQLASVGLDGSGSPGYDSSVRIWDVDIGQQSQNLSGFTLRVGDIALHPYNTLIASAHSEPLVRLWDISISTSHPIAIIDAKEPVWSVAFSPDGKTLATGSYEISLWDIPSYRLQKVLKTHRTGAIEIGYSFDGRFLAGVSQRHFVRIWDLMTGEIHRIPEKPKRFRDFGNLAFCPSANLLALSITGGNIWIWDLETNTRQISIQSNYSIFCLAFSPDKKHIVSGDEHTLKLWDSSIGQATDIFPMAVGDTNIHIGVGAIAFNGDGTLIAFSDWSKRTRLLDIEAWSELASIPGHTWIATKLLFSSDNTLLISSSADGTIRLYGIPSATHQSSDQNVN